MIKTVQVSARILSPNALPFSGYIRVSLHPSLLELDLDGESKIFVSEFANQKFPFRRDKETRIRLIPNSVLGENTYYTVEIWKTEKSGIGSKDVLIHKSDVIVPEADCNLADLVITEPLVIEPIEASKLYAAEAKSAVASGKEVLARADDALKKAKSFFVWDVVKGSDVQVYAAPLVNFEIFAELTPRETPPVNGNKSPENPSTLSGNTALSISVGEVSGQKDTYTSVFPSPVWGGYLDLALGEIEISWEGHEFNGTENFEMVTIDGKRGFSHTFERASITGGSDETLRCSHFVPAPHGLGSCYVTNGGFSVVMVPVDQTIENVDEFKAWLSEQKESGHPCVVVRKFESPTETVEFEGFEALSLAQDDYFTPKLNIVTSNVPIILGYPVSPTYLYQKLSVAVLSLGGNV